MPARPRRSVAIIGTGAAGLLLVLGACSSTPDPLDSVTKAVLEPQGLFVSPVTTACPEVPDGVTPTPGEPKAVCVEVKNDGADAARYTVTVLVRNKRDADVVYSQVNLTTGSIPPGTTGAGAAPAPGTEKILDKPTDQQKDEGFVPENDVLLDVTAAVRTPG